MILEEKHNDAEARGKTRIKSWRKDLIVHRGQCRIKNEKQLIIINHWMNPKCISTINASDNQMAQYLSTKKNP